MRAYRKYKRVEHKNWYFILFVATSRRINAGQKLQFHSRNYRGFLYFNFMRYRDAIGAVHKYYDVNKNIEKC